MPQKKMPRTRLNVLVPSEIYTKLKEMAIKRNCTMTIFVIQAILKKMREEKQYD